MSKNNTLQNPNTEEDQWLSIADIMSGLMVIFLFVALSLILNDRKKIDQYKEVRLELFNELQKEFETDFKKWNVDFISNELSIRFKDTDVLFQQNKAEIPPRFQQILDEFIPRYLAILTKPQYKDEIKELKIKGHTSSEASYNSETKNYFYNMELSQDRTRKVLEYVISISPAKKKWLMQTMTANGLSSSQIITNQDGIEDRESSRRVEFEIQTRTDKILKEVSLEKINK